MLNITQVRPSAHNLAALTALVAANDLLALGAYQELAARGLDGVERAPPIDLQVLRGVRAVAQWIAIAARKTARRLGLDRASAQLQFIALAQTQACQGIEPAHPGRPVGARQPVVGTLVGRDPQTQVRAGMTPAQKQILDAVLTATQSQRQPLGVLGVAADDVDHPQKGP